MLSVWLLFATIVVCVLDLDAAMMLAKYCVWAMLMVASVMVVAVFTLTDSRGSFGDRIEYLTAPRWRLR